jgi:hypothetical protein
MTSRDERACISVLYTKKFGAYVILHRKERIEDIIIIILEKALLIKPRMGPGTLLFKLMS